NFIGTLVSGYRHIRAVIKTPTPPLLSFLTGGDVYAPARADGDREQLRTYYRNPGYADANVTEARAEYDPAAKGFTLTFRIDEGELYHFGKIDVALHVPGLDPGNLRTLLLARNGAVFDGSVLDKTGDGLAI